LLLELYNAWHKPKKSCSSIVSVSLFLVRPAPSLKVINFNYSHTGAVVLSAHHGRIIAGRERCDKGGFQFVRRRESSGFNLSLLAAAIAFRLPVIVGRDSGTAVIVQFQRGILQRICNS